MATPSFSFPTFAGKPVLVEGSSPRPSSSPSFFVVDESIYDIAETSVALALLEESFASSDPLGDYYDRRRIDTTTAFALLLLAEYENEWVAAPGHARFWLSYSSPFFSGSLSIEESLHVTADRPENRLFLESSGRRSLSIPADCVTATIVRFGPKNSAAESWEVCFTLTNTYSPELTASIALA